MIKCMLDKQKFHKKPTGFETAGIQKRLSQIEIEIEELSILLSNGCTFKPALLNGTKSTNWISQQIFALDFDGNTTIQEELKRCVQLNLLPVFGYTSFSHTEEKHKFRLVFATQSPICDIEIRNKIQLTLIKTFYNSDQVTFDPTRIFYGGKLLIYKNIDNRIDENILMNTYFKDEYLTFIPNSKVKKNKINKSKPVQSSLVVEVEGCGDLGMDNINNNLNLYIKAIKNLDSNTLKSLMNKSFDSAENLGGQKERFNLSVHLTSTPLKPLCTNEFEVKLKINSKNKLYEYINKINLYEFLGLNYNNKFVCILEDHNDNNPSSSIYTTDNGTQIYKCFGCGFTAGILKLIEKIANCSKVEAINFVKKVYNIKLEMSEWQQKQIDTYDANIEYLVSDLLEIEYPKLHKYIKNKIPQLIQLNVLAKHYLDDIDMSIDNKSIFFISLGKLINEFDTNSKDTVTKTINLFCILDLLKKLPEDQIPKEMLNKAKHIAALAKQHKIRNHYQIPAYQENILKNSEKQAQILQDNHFLMKGLSREWVIRTFDIATANEIYPLYQFENEQGTTKASDERTKIIQDLIIKSINKKGYAKEDEIIKKLSKTFDRQTIDLQFKRSLQQIIEFCDLVKLQTNKSIKEKYKIKTKGYLFIYVKNDIN